MRGKSLSHLEVEGEELVLSLHKDLLQRHQSVVFLRLELEEVLVEDPTDPIILVVLDLSAEWVLECSYDCSERT